MKITLLKGFLLVGAILSFGLMEAQEVTVTGTVTDANGPLPGASVVVQGTTTGTQTDFDGNYTLDGVPSDGTLVFSYIGYSSQQVPVNGRTTINIALEESAEALSEVVIIGYGTTTVKDATGSVSAVTSEDFNTGVISSPEELIQGKTAGVQITQSSGEPGAGIDFRIRGTNSVRSNNNPLFVVDGVPLTSENTSAGGSDIGFGTSAPRNPLNFLNPSDIESISVLKDASATAIYGSRGANGVVIITTKSGKGAARNGVVEYSSNIGVSTPADTYDLLNKKEFLSAVAQYGGTPADQNFGADTDWQDYVTRTAVSTNQNVSYSQNYGQGSVRGTFGYAKQNGVVQNSSLERLTGRINALHRFLDDKLVLNLQATISRINDESAPLSGSAGFQGDLLGAAYSANPTWPTSPNFNPGGQLSPATMLAYIQNTTQTDRALLNFSAEYNILPELKGKVTLGYDYSTSTRIGVVSSLGRNIGRGAFGNGRGSLNDLDTESKLLEATLNYNKDFGDSNLDALVGYSFQDFNRKGRDIEAWGFQTTDMNKMGRDIESSARTVEQNINGEYQQYGFDTRSSMVFVNRLFPGSNPTSIAQPVTAVRSLFADTYDNTDELQSFFARVNYTLADKYLFTVTMRADGSSRFGSNNQYGYFPSGAFAWKIAEEDFMGDTFSTLKLRLGYGITGNQEGLGYGNFVRRERYASTGIADGGTLDAPGLTAVAFANPDLKWEETTSYNVGLDFGILNDRLSGNIDVYRKETTDLLLLIQAAQPSPQPTFFKNLNATVLNQGIEFALSYDIIQMEDVNWNASFNVAYNENELKDFAGAIQAGTIRGQGLSNAFAQILAGGHPLFSYFLREFQGFDQNGQPIGDVQSFIGKDALPNVNAGFSTNLKYKNWDLSAYLAGQFGFYVYNNTQNAFFTAGAINNARNVTKDVLTSGESGNAEAAVSTRFLEKGDFVRLQNATVGYTVPLTGEGLFKSLRLSLTGQNLFLITNYSGLDPEVSTQPGSSDLLNSLPTAGIDYTSFPRPRTISFGLNATF